MKLLKLNLVCIINCTSSKKRTEIWTIDFKKLNFKKSSSAGKKTARFLLSGACDSYVPYVRCVGWKPRFRVTRCCKEIKLLDIMGSFESMISRNEKTVHKKRDHRVGFSTSKCTKMRLWPGHCPGPHGESLQWFPDPLAGLTKGPRKVKSNPLLTTGILNRQTSLKAYRMT